MGISGRRSESGITPPRRGRGGRWGKTGIRVVVFLDSVATQERSPTMVSHAERGSKNGYSSSFAAIREDPTYWRRPQRWGRLFSWKSNGLGPYQIVGKLGRGGMGDGVWAVHARRASRPP